LKLDRIQSLLRAGVIRTNMKKGLFAELKRRHVYRVAVAYVVVAWLLVEGATQLFPFFKIPDWSIRAVVFFAIVGFPIALVLAWAFELTPEGVRRTEAVDSPDARAPEHHRQVGRRLDHAIIAVLVAAVAIMAWQRWGPHKTPAKPSATVATATPKAGAERSPAAPGSSPAANSGASTPPVAPPPAPTTVIPKKSIAVLPFENLSQEKNNGYFADGMQDLILTKLADIGDLKVISRTSTLQYGSHPQNLKKIGQELGVATLLEGSVQKAGNQVLVNVQLIDAQTDAHIWAQSYTRTLDNVFGVEGEVAAKIADALKAKLSPADTKRLATALSNDPAANDLYLRAEYFVHRASTKNIVPALKQAIVFFRKALAKAPDFALAHARLSYAESWLAFNDGDGGDVQQLIADSRAQAQQALDLAPGLAESHLAIGYYDYYGKSDYDAALKAFADALRIRPNDAAVYAARGFVLRRQGKFDQAIDALKRALTLDPRNGNVPVGLAGTYMAVNSYLEAEQVLRQALTLDPGNDPARYWYAISIVLRTGDVTRSLAVTQGDSAILKSYRALAFGIERNYDAAIATFKSIPDTPGNFPQRGDRDLRLGDYYRLAGDTVRARTHYTKALPDLRARLPEAAKSPRGAADLWNEIAGAELGLGKTDAGIAAIKAALAAADKSGDHYARPAVVAHAAIRYAQAGRAKQAVSLLSRALKMPGIGYFYSPGALWLDFRYDSIRKSAPFQALLKKYAGYRPATLPAALSE